MSSKTKTTVTKEEARPALVPKLRFPEFRGAKGWTGEKLGPKTKKVGSGITPTGGEKNYKQSGRPFVRSQNIGWGELLLDDVAFIDEKTHNSFSSTQIDVFDVLLNITGASIGRSAVADARIEGGNVNQHVCIIRVKPDELSPYFLNQYLISHDGQNQIDSFQAGGNRQGLNFEQIRSFLIPLPSAFAEQQKVAECLSSADELMAAQARKVDALKTHKKGLMQQLFPREGETQPRLRFTEFQNAGEWKRMTFGQAATFYNGRAYKQEELLESGKYPVLRVGNFFTSTTWYYSDLELDETKYCENGDLLYAWSASFGPRIWRGEKSIYHYHIWKVIEQRGIDKQFLFITLENETENMKAKTTNGLGIMHITKGAIESWESTFPTMAEQRKIADCLTTLDNTITAEIEKLDALKTHKDGLMQQLFPSLDAIQS